jgi:catechol 2,3-dioxygenase
MNKLDYGMAPEGFRLPDRTRVGRVHLQVGDLQRSIDFYEQVIGLQMVSRGEETAALAPRGGDRPLVHLQVKRGILPAPQRGAHGLYHFAILLPERADLGRFVEHLAAKGVRHAAADHLVSEALYLSDPDGLGIEVYSDRPLQTWQHSGRELAMTTEPLDLAALSAAGGGRAWVGAPAGTTIGHLHLHVGDLGEARRFYQGALGFDVTVWSYPGALFFSAGGYHHHLGTNTWGAGVDATDAHARLLDWELLVPDAADEAAKSVLSAGYRASRGDAGWLAADPWGTRVILRTP